MAAGGGSGSDSFSGDLRPVKLLCSLGGRILPRPSDGALRYAGGDTRIVSLPHTASVSVLVSKLADAYSISGQFLIRYQLPDEGLDSLISVSTQEDLENMLEEYDKLTGPSPKLRVFLFPISDHGHSSDSLDPADSDGSLRYLEAVNGIPRKDSLASLASVSVSSPTSSQSNDASRSAFITAPLIDVESDKTSPNPNPNPNIQLQEIPSESKESAKYRQPLSQLPPLPPAFLINPQNNNNNNYYNNNQERESGNYLFSEDCNLCQRHLPHAHSDTMDGKVGFAPEPLPVFHSLRPEDFNRIMAQQVPIQVPGYGYGQFVPGTENPYQYPVQMENPHNMFDLGFNNNNNNNSISVQQDLSGTNEPVQQVGGTYSSFAPVHYQSIQASNLAHFNNMFNNGHNNMYNNGPAYGYPAEANVAPAPAPVPNYLMDPVYTSIAVNNNNNNNNNNDSNNNNGNNYDDVQPMSNDFSAPPMSGSTVNAEEMQSQETVLLDPKLQGNSNTNVNLNVLPPRPKRVASKETLISPKEPIINNNNNNNKGLDLNAPIEEISLNDEPVFESVHHVKGDEFVSQDLQNMEEGLVSTNLQLSENQAQDNNHVNNEAKTKSVENPNSEAVKSKQADLINLGLPNTEDLGRLQIIRNSDLEELSELGSGTFGTVYHGKWRGSDVAIKRINDRCFAGKPSEQEKMRSDFWNEASKLADLHHPNVVAFYGVVLDGPGGSIATVTEFMVNGSLRHGLQRNDKLLDRRKRLIIAMDAAFGMEYLHSKNIVHFDLKSDNLLVNLRDPHRPICKVGDLGLSKVKCQTLISGGVRGTLPWMAPELLNGSSSLVSEKVDVFSFGIVLWELLTGEEPYADLHYGVIIGGIVSNTLRPSVPESCDPEWKSLMEQCWSSEPSDRPSFTEVVSRLRSMAASQKSS